MSAVVTYCWNRVGYNVLRSLAAQQVSVTIGDASKIPMARFSRFQKKYFQYPSFYRNSDSFVDALIDEVKGSTPKVYLPVHEEVFIASKYKNRLEQGGLVVPVSDFSILEKLHKKELLHSTCKECGVPTPEIYRISPSDNLSEIFSKMEYPVVVKESQTNSAKGVHYIYEKEGAEDTFSKLCGEKEEYPFLQEYTQGEGYGVSVLMNRGEVRAAFTHKRLREKTYTGGTSTVRVSVKEPMLEEYAVELLSKTKFHGVAMVEFKYDKKSNKAMIIDVNPRFWGSLSLAIQSGVDFPYLLYKMAMDGDVAPVKSYKEGVKVKWLLGDGLALFSEMLHTKKIISPIRGFIGGGVDGYDDFFINDPMPFVFQSIYYLSKFVTSRSMNPTQEALLNIDNI